MGQGFHRMIIRYGFMQEADVPAALARVDKCGGAFKMMDTSFFLARQTLLPAERPGMMLWREKLFAWMLRNAESAMEFFRLRSEEHTSELQSLMRISSAVFCLKNKT